VRIVSLLPSATEILFAIGAGDEVVGVTFECDFPVEARSRQIVSSSALTGSQDPGEIDAEVRSRLAAGEDLYHLDEGALAGLRPDLVVTQDLCAVCAVELSTVDAALAHLGCSGQVLTIDPATLREVLDSILTVGQATGREATAQRLVASLEQRLSALRSAVAGRYRPRVAVLEWTDPLFSAGHWVPDMVVAAGGSVALGRAGERSAALGFETLARARPEIIVVSPCGYGLGRAAELAETLLARGVLPSGIPVWAVDADAAFVRPGPRVVDGIEALAWICHPDTVEQRPDLAVLVGAGVS